MKDSEKKSLQIANRDTAPQAKTEMFYAYIDITAISKLYVVYLYGFT